MRARGLVDVLIPRGGAGLIRSVVEESTVPVIETGRRQLPRVRRRLRRPRPGARHRGQRQDPAHQRVQRRRVAARARGRRRRVPARPSSTRCRTPASPSTATPAFAEYDDVVPATDEDHASGVPLLGHLRRRGGRRGGAPIAHIRRFSSGHTEAIVARDQATIRRFVAAVDSAAVLVNASTRFTDGGEFGFGAEIGISHPEAARPRADGAARDDVHQVRRRRRRARALTGRPVGRAPRRVPRPQDDRIRACR